MECLVRPARVSGKRRSTAADVAYLNGRTWAQHMRRTEVPPPWFQQITPPLQDESKVRASVNFCVFGLHDDAWSYTPCSSTTSGHSSIINTALFHPTLPLLATSGIERFIRLHRPFHAPSSSSDSDDSWTEEYPPTRNPPKPLQAGSGDAGDEGSSLADTLALEASSDPLDMPTISMFDRIIEAESDLDIFDRGSSHRVAETDEDGDGERSEGSSSESRSEDDEIEIDV
ncbi:hypothetical protein FRC01_003829 [Tulasnella sp. 417]|nr:hypothetical protein FRC01_003829 [Tulasnella sp. 417]